MKFFKFIGVVAFTAFVLSGCITYVEMPDIEMVEKSYPKPEDISDLSFAMTQPVIKINASLTDTTMGGLIERIKYDSEKVNCFLTSEVEKVLVSKGFTITDVFESYDNMTFTEKRNTSAVFYPVITIDIEEKSQLEITTFFLSTQQVKGRLQLNAKVNIVMKEPLSDEKLWIKSLPVSDVDQTVKYYPNNYGGPELNGAFVPKDLMPIAASIDNMIEEISTKVIEATEKYVEREEFEFLNTDIEKLKKIKRY